MFATKPLALVVVLVFAALLPITNNVHARSHNVHARSHNGSPEDDTAQIVIYIQPSATAISNSNISNKASSNNVMAVTSDGNPNSFFHEDFLYTFHPTSSGEKRWQIIRTPKSNWSRKLLSAEEGASTNSKDGGENGGEGNGGRSGQEEFVAQTTNVVLSLTCVFLAALAAGLTMGMLSLDPLTLEIKRRASSNPEERQWSAELLPLLVGHSKRHRLLCSLLLMNSIANEALPLFLDELFPSKLASILASVTLVLMFGEIVPSALFTGPNQVELAAKLVPLVRVVMFLLAPLAVPIARLLDKVLHDDNGGGHGKNGEVEQDVTEGNYYNRSELSALVRIQYESQLADKRRRKSEQNFLLKPGLAGDAGCPATQAVSEGTSSSRSTSSRGNSWNPKDHRTRHSIRSISRELTAVNRPSLGERSGLAPERMPSIHQDEITMIEGALSMTTKVAADIYTPIRRLYALPKDKILDEDTMVEIWARGFSRVPVYEPKALPVDKCNSSSSESVDISGIVGILMVRQLIVVNSAENRPIDTLPLALPSCISPSMHLVDLINHFQEGGGRGKGGLHLALVCARPALAEEALLRGHSIPKDAGVVGVITLEDVVEELLQEEIYDESDRDLELAQWGVKKWKRFVTRKKSRRMQQQQKSGGMTEETPLLG